MCKWVNMGPLVEDTVQDLESIQQSLWELHKLLTDLPDDMLEDSRDSSSPELETSTCSNKNMANSPQSKWTQQWSDHPIPTSHEQANDQCSRGFAYDNKAVRINGHPHHAQNQPLAHMWHQQSQDPHFTHEDYAQTSGVAGECTEDGNVSTDRTYESKTHHGKKRAGVQSVDKYTASYNPPRQMFSSPATHQDHPFDHLQRELLDSTQQTADKEQLAQLQILKKAQHRQIEGMEQKLEDSKRHVRSLEHQLAIVKDEKGGFAVSLQESNRLLGEAKDREAEMQNKLKLMEQQMQTLNERDQENTKKQRVAEAAVDSMKQQMLELCRSDTLSKAREQHDRTVAVIKEKHEAAILALQHKLDSMSQALSEQVDIDHGLREQVKHLERQREQEQLERARVVNALTRQLEESQQQCAKLLQTSSVQEMGQIQIKLQQAHAAKALSEDVNRVLQEDLSDLKEQITLYESAFKLGVIALDVTGDGENQLSESCLDLGFKKTNRKNGTLHSMAMANLSDSKLTGDEALRQLRVEMQHCLGILKVKRQKITHLQEELQQRRVRENDLQTRLDEAKLSSSVREYSQIKHLNLTGEDQNELAKLQEDKRRLLDQVEVMEKKMIELKQSEEKVRSANLELCTKMREMIQELDQEKQEAAERSERIYQQHREDLVNQVRTELMLEQRTQVEQLAAQHEQHIQHLNTQLSETNDKMLAVQECYISVCKEKDKLEENARNREQQEYNQREESRTNVENVRAELEAQHQESISQLKSLWSKEKEAEIQRVVTSHIASAKAAWEEDRQQMERKWTLKLEEARCEKCRMASDRSCQTDGLGANCLTVTVEELNSRLSAQRLQLQLEADKVKRQAVDEARRQVQKDTQDKHLEDLANKVEGAVARAYNHWIEDLTSLPEYQASLQREKEKWEERQKQHTDERVSQALKEAEQQWHEQQQEQLRDQNCGAQRVHELQEAVVTLHSQLEQMSREQPALLKAELAGARAAWNRDKQQEISVVQARSEQAYQSRLQEQSKKLELALLQAREEADHQRKELLLQMEAKLQETLRATEDEWRSQQAEKDHTQRQQMREDFLAELQTCLGEVHTQLLSDFRTEAMTQQSNEESGRGGMSEGTILHMIHTSCKDIVDRAVSQAKKDWKKISEAQLSCVLRETQQQHERELDEMQSSLTQMRRQACSRKECADASSKLQKKNQELQKHLEKACRQFQHSVREHKMTMQKLKDEHERRLQQAQEEHLLQLDEVRKSKEAAGASDRQQNLQQGLEEMQQQYLATVEKIRGDMLRYLQESRERAAEMIRKEVQRERQDTARTMRRYYLTCLQELLEDGGKTAGAEKKIMNAASKLAAMAKVLETPIKKKPGKNHSFPASNIDFIKNPSTLPCDIRTHRGKTSDLERKTTLTRTLLVHKQDVAACGRDATGETHPYPPKAPLVTSSAFAPLRSNSREVYLQGGEPDNHVQLDLHSKPCLTQEVPVRDEKRTDRSLISSDSDSLHVPRLSHLGRKVAADLCDFGSVTPDASDLTVYKEIAQKTLESRTFPTKAKMSSHRESTSGSEAEKQHGVCSRPLFSELRRQQDSGFDSPFYQPK
ncbi:centrosomal protein of 152 kDa isoform X2 [Dunckerocampus dactyliophorus]|uniref:centrosomal protein of 152 kDa isoform X2 n=1 Tax=Dunckerocampus dactyliophorus TaxID=161453 RepID=UPI002405DC08|nr:centrosomal protein of 152 kDa isoform X2 [Dunckerocampus dactyliophorus]